MEEGPEPQEWVERAAEEHHHHAHAEGHAEAGESHATGGLKPETQVSAITAAVLAVLAAIGSLLSGHAANEGMLAQTKAADQWSFFQAESTKGHLYEVAGEIVQTLASSTARANPHFLAESARYRKEKEEIKKEAEHLEAESRHEFRKHHRFALGVALFQVGIVLASVSILVRSRPLYALSLVMGTGGLIGLGTGLLA